METWKKFDADGLTHSATHHLLAIEELGRQYGGWARVSDIARHLGITRGSVSISLGPLKERGLVEVDEHRMVKLSPQAQTMVDEVLAKREALERFLSQVLGLTPEQASVDSCKIEHLISPRAAERLVQFMKFIAGGDPAARELVQRFRQYEGDCPTDGNCAVCQGKCLLARLAEVPGAG